jgi:hypothetical protein
MDVYKKLINIHDLNEEDNLLRININKLFPK